MSALSAATKPSFAEFGADFSAVVAEAKEQAVEAVLSRGGPIASTNEPLLETWFPRLLQAGRIGRAPTAEERAQMGKDLPRLPEVEGRYYGKPVRFYRRLPAR